MAVFSSTARQTVLQSLLDTGGLRLPALSEAPKLNLPAELNYFRPHGDTLIVYRGDFVASENHGHFARIWTARDRGFFSQSFSSGMGHHPFGERLQNFWSFAERGDTLAACHEVARQVERGPFEFVTWLIDRHTDAVEWSPFVSTTPDPKLAAKFAPERSMSVFQCSIPMNRCLLDATNLGGTGASGELLVLGWIGAKETKLCSAFMAGT